MRYKTPLTVSACFHAQQCAEKYLKALLVAKGQTFPKTHDLPALSTLCAQAGVLVEVSPAQLGTLSLYAVQGRYPGGEPTLVEAKEAVGIARTVRRFARRVLGVQ
jgi:HEPN domain-containing protein